MQDLAQIERLANESGPMVCTLPADRELLKQKIAHSEASFDNDVWFPGEESYFFVLEETTSGHLSGTAVASARAGFGEPFYAFRNDVFIHSSRPLGVHNRVHALTLTHDLSDYSRLSSFYIESHLRTGPYAALLTFGRLLYMCTQPQRFADEWMAVLPGIADADGYAPFWEHVGRKFLGMDYNQVEYHHGTRASTFIAELMPHHSLYVPLIDEQAQAVMGQVHPDAQLQYELLSQQGFNGDKYVEVFDAGPIMTASKQTSNVWNYRHPVKVKVAEQPQIPGATGIVATLSETGFYAALGTLNQQEQIFCIDPDLADAVNISHATHIWCLPLSSVDTCE